MMFARVFTILGIAAASAMAAEFNLTQYLNETIEYVQEVKNYTREQLNELAQNKKEYKR